MENMEQERSTKKKRFDKKLLILPAAVLVTAGVVLGLLFLINGDGEEHTVYDSDAFFIRETSSASSNYALFNKKGEKKTLTSEDLKYHTPGTGPYWDKLMWSARKKDIIKKTQDFLNRGGK